MTPSAAPTAVAAPPCDAEAPCDAPELTSALAQEVSGAGVLVGDVTTEPGTSPTYEVTQVGPEAAASPEHAAMVRLSAVDGGEIPAHCELSTSSRLLVLVGDAWMEGRPVRCSEDT